MTKLEAIEYLLEVSDEVTKKFANKWSDEEVLDKWNYKDNYHKKGLRLIKIGDEFQIEYHYPLYFFTKDALEYFSNNQ